MKQHITLEQFNELSHENLKKLKDWVFSKLQASAEAENPGQFISIRPPTVYDICLSIGQMVEFLDEKNNNHEPFTLERILCDDDYHEPKCQLGWYLNDKYQETELCDTLWEAVKQELES